MVQDQNHSKTRFISFDRFVLIQGVVIDILLPVDVEKLLFQSFPVHRLNLQKLKKRDFWLHFFIFTLPHQFNELSFTLPVSLGSCCCSGARRLGWKLDEHQSSGCGMALFFPSHRPEQMECWKHYTRRQRATCARVVLNLVAGSWGVKKGGAIRSFALHHESQTCTASVTQCHQIIACRIL